MDRWADAIRRAHWHEDAELRPWAQFVAECPDDSEPALWRRLAMAALSAFDIEDYMTGYAAGRTRGIEEERQRREGEIKPLIGKLHTLCLDFDARELDDVKHAIWKAVTGEAQ